MTDIISLSAVDLSKAIRDKQVSCRQVMKAYLEHIDKSNRDVNAIVALRPWDELLDESANYDDQLKQGVYLGPFHGFPMAPKDIPSVKGLPTTLGSVLFKDRVTNRDELLIRRLRQAGAIFIGRTTCPEFGLGSHTYSNVWGRTGNAFNPRLSAGGSSGGAAVALARRMLPVADGSDSMGSLRNPGAWNQVYGFRPSVGLIPADPSANDLFTHGVATNGPMARTPQDLELLFRVMADPEPRIPFSIELGDSDPSVLPTSIRVGWLGDLGHLAIEPDLLEFAHQGTCKMTTLPDITLESVRVEFGFAALWKAWVDLRHASNAALIRSLGITQEERRAVCKPELNWEVDQVERLTVGDLSQANAVRTAWWRTLVHLFDSYDFLVLPSTQGWPFPVELDWPHQVAGRTMDTYHRWMEVVLYASIAGVPAVNVPIGFKDGNLDKPAGIQVLAPKAQDGKLLAFIKKTHPLFQ